MKHTSQEYYELLEAQHKVSALYWRSVALDSLSRLIQLGEVVHSDDTNEFIWKTSGRKLGGGS